MRSVAASIAPLLLLACSADDSQQNVYANVDMNADLTAPIAAGGPKAARETAEQRKKRLREKAKTDPEGADAEAIANMSRNEVIASAINSAGFLCARVVSAYPAGSNINVDCVEYRSGNGRVKYSIDPKSGTVEQR
jgi:hypothetical protein